MLTFNSFQLPNGLRVLIHRVPSSKVAVCNLMYKVGSGDEKPSQTGIAHLFEHLMFSGSKHVPSYDKALQQVGGQNNAYTTFDVTNYYCVVPSANIETALWLESDRMFHLNCTATHLEVQRKVVIEEFNQTCFSQPYGDVWHHLLDLAYVDHPYSWPTIVKEKSHIAEVTLEDIQAFGKRFYKPSNAVLVIAGGVEVAHVQRLSEQWFGEGSAQPAQRYVMPLTAKNKRKGTRRKVCKELPYNTIHQAYHIPGRADSTYLSLSCLCHLLGTGKSSFLYQKLVQEKKWLTDLSVYTTEMLHGGLFVIEGELQEGSDFASVEATIHETIQEVCEMKEDTTLWEKVKNQMESEYAFHHMKLFDRADTLAMATWVEAPDFFNHEIGARLPKLAFKDMQHIGKRFLRSEDAIVLCYAKK